MAYGLHIGLVIKLQGLVKFGPPPPHPSHSLENLGPLQNEVKTKVFSKLNTLDLSLVRTLFLDIVELHQDSVDLPGSPNRPCEADFRETLVKKGPAGSLHGPKWSMSLDRSQDNRQT